MRITPIIYINGVNETTNAAFLLGLQSAHNVGLVEFTRMANALGYELVLRPQKTVVFEELADIFSEDD